MEYVFFVVISVIAGAVQGISGMGHGMITIATASFFFPYLPLMISIKLMSFVFFAPVIFMWKKIKWKILITPLIFSYVGTYVGTLVLNVSNGEQLTFLLGVLLAVFGIFNVLCNNKIVFKPKWWIGAIAGIISGFFSAIASMAGPPLVIYYLNIKELEEDKNAFYATMITTYQLMFSQQVVVLAMSNAIPKQSFTIFFASIIPLLIGLWFGRKFVKKMNVEKIKFTVNLLMSFMGVYLIITNFTYAFS